MTYLLNVTQTLFRRATSHFYIFKFLFVFSICIALSALLGLLTGLGAYLPSVIVAASCLSVFFFLLVYYDSGGRYKDGLFWLFFFLLMFLPVLLTLTGMRLFFLVELLLIFCLFLSLFHLKGWLIESAHGRIFLLLLGMFILASIASSIYGRSTMLASTYQFFTNFKFFALLFFGFLVSWTDKTQVLFWRFIQWAWLPLLVLITIQWLFPSVYFSVVSYVSHEEAKHPFFSGLTRGLGWFQHASFLAAYAGIFAVYSFAKWRCEGKWYFAVVCIAYFLVLICSGQRQELLAVAIAIVFILGISSKKMITNTLLSLFIGGIAIVLFFSWFGMDDLTREAERWGVIGNSQLTIPRVVTYMDAISIANWNWPLGSGLGTFASAGAEKFDLSYHFDLGYKSFDWFLEKNYLLDAFWASYIGEVGWIGSAAMFMMLISIVIFSAQQMRAALKEKEKEKLYWMMAFGGSVFVFVCSPTSPILTDPSIGLLPLLFFGVAFNIKNKRRIIMKETK